MSDRLDVLEGLRRYASTQKYNLAEFRTHYILQLYLYQNHPEWTAMYYYQYSFALVLLDTDDLKGAVDLPYRD